MSAGRSASGRVLLDLRCLQTADASRGLGTYARGLFGALLQAGFGNRLAVLLDAGLPEPDLPGGEFLGYGVRRRYHGRFAAYEDAVALGADLERIRPGLFHALTFSLPGRAAVPLVVTLHDLIPWALGGGAYRGERLRFGLARRLLRNADLVLAVSEATRQDALRLAGLDPRRLQVVPPGVGAAFAPRPGARERVAVRWGLEPGYLLHVGALDPRKRPRQLVAVWQAVRRARPGLELVLAGASAGRGVAAEPGLQGLGEVTEDELVDLLCAAGCLLFTSAYEGFGLPLLEAMACGCPVAAFDNSSVGEVGDGAVVLAPDGNVQVLAGAVAGLLADGRERTRLSQAGRRRAAHFSWRASAGRVIAAYETLLP